MTYFDFTEPSENDLIDVGQGRVFRCVIDELLLVPGRYRIDVTIYIGKELQDHVERGIWTSSRASSRAGW